VSTLGSNARDTTPPVAGGNGGRGPVNRFAYLVAKAIECGLDPARELRSLLERWLVSIDHAVCTGDVEGVLESIENLLDLAGFIRSATRAPVMIGTSADEAERARFVSLLRARADSLKEWAARARRLARLAVQLQHDPAYWPGPGAMYGSPRWQIAHDSLAVISLLALPLARVAEGDGEPLVPDDPIAMAAATMLDPLGVARAAKEAHNILRGGRRDTSRGADLRETCNTICAYLLLGEEHTDHALSLSLLSWLADRFGNAFREPSVLTACIHSLARHRVNQAIPTIAAEVVLAAWRTAESGIPSAEHFRFPIENLDTRARTSIAGLRGSSPKSRAQGSAKRLLMQDFAKAFRAKKKAGSVQ
jgi:hypothetical protein